MCPQKWEELFRDDYSVFGGELLVTKLGDPPGDCAIYPSSRGPSMLTPDVIKLDVDEGVAVPRFVMHYLNSVAARRYTFGAAFGTTRLRLTLPLFRKMPIPLPPLAEQIRIASEVDRLLTVTETIEQQVELDALHVRRLGQSALKWAFEGRLVDQDPTAEPASALLERIKAERAAAAGKRGPGRRSGRLRARGHKPAHMPRSRGLPTAQAVEVLALQAESIKRAPSRRSSSNVLMYFTPRPTQALGILTILTPSLGCSSVTTVWPWAWACATR